MQKAAKRPKSTHKQKPINKSKRIDRIVLVITLAVLAVGSIFYLWAVVFGGMYADEKVMMERYLQEKYGKQFEVYSLKTQSCGLGCQESVGAKSHPVEDKTLEFELSGHDGYYSDEYPGAVWAREEHANLKPFLTEVFWVYAGV